MEGELIVSKMSLPPDHHLSLHKKEYQKNRLMRLLDLVIIQTMTLFGKQIWGLKS
jgi:hypothetical protein